VTAVAWPAQLHLARELATAAAHQSPWPDLPPRPLDSLRLIVVPSAKVLDSLTGGRLPEWGVGLALPGQRTVVLRADDDDVRRTLRHELAHLALHRAVPVRVPLWFDEGYAAMAAGEWDRLGGLELNLAVVRGATPDLVSLDGALRASATTADAAYALAVSAVSELARRNPNGSLAPLLSRLSQGEDFEAAVLATTGLTVSRFEEAWQRSVRRRYSVGTWLIAGGGWAVLAAVLLVVTRLRRRADRARRAALDQDWDVTPETPDRPELDHSG
jgi:hypothetical protein